jgi:hypothetical protein
MPDATITSTASTFGTISGTFAADQSTVTGTITGVVAGTLSGSVGVPGPAGAPGVGVPAGGTSGQFLQKTSDVSYETDWVTVNLAGLATESWVTAGFYPLTGNPSGFLTAASLSGYATESFVTSQGYITSAALSPYITSATATASFYPLSGNPSGFLTSAPVTSVAGKVGVVTLDNTDISGLGTLAVVNDAPSDGSQYARKNGAWDVVTTAPDFISSVSSPLAVTTGNLTVDLSAYAPLASPAFTGTPTAPTPSPGTDSTQIATTAWVKGFDYAPTNSPTLTGNPKSVTPSTGDNDTSIATTAFVKAQNYITSSALTPYLTTADAATTYYPLTNPDGFMTVAVGDSYYYPLTNPDGFITAYNADFTYLKQSYNLSDLTDFSAARTNLGLGTMATATAADYSTTTVANGLYYPLSSNPSSYLVAADIAGKADLASPTFTGTPSLPTGTIGVTQTAGNNTTALATTAFVTTAVPAFATFTTPGVNSTNTIVSPRVAMDYLMHPGRTEWLKFGNGATSGTGASVVAGTSTRNVQIVGPNVGVAGYAMAVWDTTFSGFGMLGMTRGVNMGSRAWDKPVWASGRGQIGFYGDNNFNGDANSTVRVSVGGKSSVGSGPISVNDAGFGWLVPGVGNALQLQVSKGDSSALTTVTSSFTPVAKQVFDWKMHSDGAGNVTLWINDNVVATTTAGPTTATAEISNFYFEMVEQTASTATRIVWESLNSRVWWGV